jgi:hypothetical protein
VTCSGAGIRRDVWTGISGSSLSDLLSGSNNFNDPPDQSEVRNTFEAPTNDDDNYGQRLRALLCVPADGDYTLLITSRLRAVKSLY